MFIWIDNFALTAIYCLLYLPLRSQLRKFARRSSEAETSEYTSEEGYPGFRNLTHESQTSTGQIASDIPMITVSTKEPRSKDRQSLSQRSNSRSNELNRERRCILRAATTLFCYLLVYIMLTMTLSITHLANFVYRDWGHTIIFAGASVYTCGGWCNVLLYTATRRGIVPWNWFG